MYKVAKIIFKPKITDEEEISENICDILSMLYQNGQILNEWIVEKQELQYIANVITTDDDSLDSKYYNCYILKKLDYFDIDIEIICDDPMSFDSCHCDEHSYYILFVDPNDKSSPIICGNCGKEIPLIRIPYLYNEKEHYSILHFQRMYEAVFNLWLDTLSDRFTKRQVVDHNSQLNKTGMDICTELEKLTNKPVYYFLLNPIGGLYQFEKNNKELDFCPKCGGNFTKINHAYIDKICHTCRLAFIDKRNVDD